MDKIQGTSYHHEAITALSSSVTYVQQVLRSSTRLEFYATKDITQIIGWRKVYIISSLAVTFESKGRSQKSDSNAIMFKLPQLSFDLR